jgi:hypothetical protein
MSGKEGLDHTHAKKIYKKKGSQLGALETLKIGFAGRDQGQG